MNKNPYFEKEKHVPYDNGGITYTGKIEEGISSITINLTRYDSVMENTVFLHTREDLETLKELVDSLLEFHKKNITLGDYA